MLKRTVKYTDFDGNEQSDELYFNLTKSELIGLELSEEGGMEKRLLRMVEEKDARKIFNMFKKIILLAYGEKSIDGKTFNKSNEIRVKFEHSAAFDALYMDLISDEKKMADFINGVIPELPADAKAEAEKKVAALMQN